MQRRKLRQREAQSLVQDPSAVGVPRLPDTESGLLTTTPNCLRGYYHHPNRMLMMALISIIAEGSAAGRQIWVTASLGPRPGPVPRTGQRPVPAGPRTMLRIRGPRHAAWVTAWGSPRPPSDPAPRQPLLPTCPWMCLVTDQRRSVSGKKEKSSRGNHCFYKAPLPPSAHT